jgi:RNA polymerase sigma factor (sigma-70 family)
MLSHLAKIQPELIKMAKSLDYKHHEDILQETYLKLYDSKKEFKEIDKGYIYLTMRSVFIDGIRKKKEIPIDDFSRYEDLEDDIELFEINKSILNAFEKELINAHYGKVIEDKEKNIIYKTQSYSLLKLSKMTSIPYRTLYTTLKKIKLKLCRE